MTSQPTTFVKASMEAPDPIKGFAPSRGTVVVGTEHYDRLIARGYRVVETWNVWRCTTCGMNDNDRDAWEYPGASHRARYGHDSTRP